MGTILNISIILLFFSIFGSAQRNISGYIKEESGDAIEFCKVELTNEKGELLRGTMTDINGHWSLLVSEPLQNANLIINMIGFNIKIIPVSTITFYSTILTRKSILLEEVTITAKSVKAVLHGDTTSYNPILFSNRYSQDLKDILENIPDFEIDSKGTILYHGKEITNLTVDGSNIFNQSHSGATTGIRKDHIKSIDIIKSIHDNDVIKLNIDLEEEAKAKMLGKYSIFSNIGKYNDITLEPFWINKETSLRLRGSYNSIGKSGVTADDIFRSEKNIAQLLTESEGNLDNLLPPFLFMPLGLKENKDIVLSGSFIINRPKTFTYEIHTTNMVSRRKYGSNVRFLYIDRNEIIQRTDIGDMDVRYHQVDQNFIMKRQSWDLSLFFPLIYFDYSDKTLHKQIGSQTIVGNDLIKNSTIRFQPSLIYNKQLKNHLSNNFSINCKYHKKEDDLALFLQIPSEIFATNQIYQERTQTYNYLQVSESLSKSYKSFRFGPTLLYSRDNIRLSHENIFREPQLKTKYLLEKMSSNIYGAFDSEHWYIKVSLGINLINRIAYQDEVSRKKTFQYDANVKYLFSKLHNFGIYIKNNNDFPSLIQLDTSRIIIDVQNIQQGLIPIESLFRNRSLGIQYNNVNPGKLIFVLSLRTSQLNNLPQLAVVPFGGINILNWKAKNNGTSQTANVHYSQSLKAIPIRLQAKINYNRNDVYFTALKELLFKNSFLNMQGKISSNWKKSFTYALQMTWSRNILSTNERNFKSESLSPLIQLNYFPKNWKISVENGLNIQKFEGVQRVRPLTNISLSRKIPKWFAEFELRAINVFNLNGITYGNYLINQNIIQETTYETFAGYIQGGVKVLF